jgi:hypothetical protein
LPPAHIHIPGVRYRRGSTCQSETQTFASTL